MSVRERAEILRQEALYQKVSEKEIGLELSCFGSRQQANHPAVHQRAREMRPVKSGPILRASIKLSQESTTSVAVRLDKRADQSPVTTRVCTPHYACSTLFISESGRVNLLAAPPILEMALPDWLG
ncbi:hypothetical protein RRG08_038075 [Elysia crispata]|uniref:Uncharacterized protein n=1 Tax=Elysia crispata TaxID=231223 RepID=A0AAE1DP10_9GAST|nr:hypothetical protein RRG08_038075 [Elysia crispata]